MAYPSITNTFVASTTAQASQVNQNFTDLVNGFSDGTKDANMNDITVNGTFTLNSTMEARTIVPQVDGTYDLGSTTKEWKALYVNGIVYCNKMELESTQQVQFRDAAIYVNSDADGYMDLHADTAVRVNNNLQTLGTLDVDSTLNVDGASTMSGNVGMNGTLSVASSTVLTGDTSLGTATVAGALTLSGAVSVGSDLTVRNIYPAADDTYDIGSAAAEVKDIYSDGVIYSDKVELSDASTVQFRDSDTYIYSESAGHLNLAASTSIRPMVDVIPRVGNSYDLGSSASKFKDLYIDGTANLDACAMGQGYVTFWDSSIRIGSSGDSTLDINSDATVIISAPTTVVKSIQPQTDNTHDIGDLTHSLRNMYIDGTIQGAGAVSMTSDAGISWGDASQAKIAGGTSTATVYALTQLTLNSPDTQISSGALTQIGGHVLLNSGKGAYDLSVHGDTESNVLHVDGGTDRVGVLTSAPTAPLDVNGTAAVGGVLFHGADTGMAILNKYQTGNFTASPTGIGTATSGTFYYTKIGQKCTLFIPALYGVSTATTFSIPTTSFPTGVAPRAVADSDRAATYLGSGHMYKSATVGQSAAMLLDSDALFFYTCDGTDYNATGWPASENKGMKWGLEVTYQTD